MHCNGRQHLLPATVRQERSAVNAATCTSLHHKLPKHQPVSSRPQGILVLCAAHSWGWSTEHRHCKTVSQLLHAMRCLSNQQMAAMQALTDY